MKISLYSKMRYTTKVVIIAAIGRQILNVQCFVLCLKIFIPSNAPIPPSKRAERSRVFSEIRYLFFLACLLSRKKRIKAFKFNNPIIKITMICNGSK